MTPEVESDIVLAEKDTIEYIRRTVKDVKKSQPVLMLMKKGQTLCLSICPLLRRGGSAPERDGSPASDY